MGDSIYDRCDAVDGLAAVARQARGPVAEFLGQPRALEPEATLPLVIVQHGLDGDRSDALAVANELAAAGYAVVAADAPFHGSASDVGDRMNRFTGASEADGFGDGPGDG